MQLATIEMSKTEARKAFLEYRRSVRERHDAEDEQIMRGYRALASGHQLIRLSETLRAGGTEERRVTIRNWQNERELLDVRVPKLAVARADMKMAYTAGIGREGGLLVTTEFPDRDLPWQNRKNRHRLPSGTFEPGENSGRATLKAIIPNVPPPLRPHAHLRNYLVLWEADWKVHPVPPGDPALLKHIGGDLYAVVAVWDLTPLEQAVLAARADT
jgi:hypothetical protein